MRDTRFSQTTFYRTMYGRRTYTGAEQSALNEVAAILDKVMCTSTDTDLGNQLNNETWIPACQRVKGILDDAALGSEDIQSVAYMAFLKEFRRNRRGFIYNMMRVYGLYSRRSLCITWARAAAMLLIDMDHPRLGVGEVVIECVDHTLHCVNRELDGHVLDKEQGGATPILIAEASEKLLRLTAISFMSNKNLRLAPTASSTIIDEIADLLRVAMIGSDTKMYPSDWGALSMANTRDVIRSQRFMDYSVRASEVMAGAYEAYLMDRFIEALFTPRFPLGPESYRMIAPPIADPYPAR